MEIDDRVITILRKTLCQSVTKVLPLKTRRTPILSDQFLFHKWGIIKPYNVNLTVLQSRLEWLNCENWRIIGCRKNNIAYGISIFNNNIIFSYTVTYIIFLLTLFFILLVYYIHFENKQFYRKKYSCQTWKNK